MKAPARSLILLASLLPGGLFLGACVSQTTGALAPQANLEDAADFNYELGARYLRAGNYELARDRLQRSLEIDEKQAIAWSALALTYERLQNPRLASEAYREAVRVEPRNFDVLNTYAVFLCRQGEYDEAREYFDRAIGIPENDNAFVTMTNAGVCMKQKPDRALAESYMRQALKRRPNYGEGLLQLAILKFENGKNLGARAFLERYVSDNPPSSAVLLLGIRIEERLGDDRARAAYVERLLESFPDSTEARSIREAR